MAQIVWELRALFDKAGAAPPYVLAGHSLGFVATRNRREHARHSCADRIQDACS
jgi:hypothetical protein